MNLTRTQREELNALSKQVFGTASKWKKLVENGFPEEFTREREVLVPKASGQMVAKKFTDRKYVTKRYTVEEIRKFMTDALEARKSNPGPVKFDTIQAVPLTPEVVDVGNT